MPREIVFKDYLSNNNNCDYLLYDDQWWNVTKYIHSSIVLKYKFDVLFYFYSATFQREILYFLLHYINLTVLVTLQIKIFAHKTYVVYKIQC